LGKVRGSWHKVTSTWKRVDVFVLCLLAASGSWALKAPAILAEEAKDEQMVIREQKGLRFKLPADWPIEQRDGVLSPVPVEAYLSRKFSSVTSRLEAMERRIDGLEKRLRSTEQGIDGLKNNLASLSKQDEAKKE